jgi:hypothetical protein
MGELENTKDKRLNTLGELGNVEVKWSNSRAPWANEEAP